MSASKAVVLCLRLLMIAPPDLTARTRAALEAVREACIALQAIARQRLRSSPENLKKVRCGLPGRGPNEAEELLQWMMENEDAWRVR